MNVIINGLLLDGRPSGVKYYIEQLLLSLSSIGVSKDSLNVLLSQNYQGPLLEQLPAIQTIDSKSRIRRVIWENFFLKKQISKKFQNFIFHSPGYVLPFYFPSPNVVTIHDLITFQFPNLCPPHTRWYYQLRIPPTIKKANKIITVSHQVKADIMKYFKLEKDKIEVVHLGVDKAFQPVHNPARRAALSGKYQLAEKFILFVGVLEPKKNIKGLIEAYHHLLKYSDLPHDLVIVGRKGWKSAELFSLVKDFQLQDKIHFIGFVEEKDLPVLYTLADLFVFPSFYEGFGLPVVEAMSCGTPVVISDRGALPEVSGGIYPMVDPGHIPSLSEAMFKMISDKTARKAKIAEARDFVKQYSWEKTAAQTNKVYHETFREWEST